MKVRFIEITPFQVFRILFSNQSWTSKSHWPSFLPKRKVASPPWSGLVASSHDFIWGSCLAEGSVSLQSPPPPTLFLSRSVTAVGSKHTKKTRWKQEASMYTVIITTFGGSTSPNLGVCGKIDHKCIKPGKNCIGPKSPARVLIIQVELWCVILSS